MTNAPSERDLSAWTGRVERWVERLERRHTAALTFPEIRRALQALSSVYVERRTKLSEGAALDGNGKRAAFALYYGVRHFLLVRQVVRAVGGADPAPRRILDLGCGTGAAGAAWAVEAGGRSEVVGVDRNGWVVQEAKSTFADLGLRGRAHVGDAGRTALEGFDGIVSSYTVNELPGPVQDTLLGGLLEAGRAGTRVLVLEPLARKALAWWPAWEAAFAAAGGRADEWRFTLELPGFTQRLGHAAGLDTRLLTCRSLWLPGRPPRVRPGLDG